MQHLAAQATPTKTFFISLITRDVNITDCIKDLIDNSVDGALRNSRGDNLDRFKISLTVEQKKFEIDDNCGGIDLYRARDYAFRFGAVDGKHLKGHLVSGRYGIGMKRSIFKLGNEFSIAAKTVKNFFTMNVDIEEWQRDETPPWTFPLDGGKQTSLPPETYTKIMIPRLREEVAQEFSDPGFLLKLRYALTAAYGERIRQGLRILLNGKQIELQRTELLSSRFLKPIFRNETIDGVRLRVYAGLASRDDNESKSEDCGWYIFCNDRLLLAGDKSAVSGWGKDNKNPSFHPQYNQFRGYAFFESNDPDKLPWNTSKNQANTESKVFRGAKPFLVNALSEVVEFLNKRKRAVSQKDRSYDALLKSSTAVEVSNIVRKSDHFEYKLAKERASNGLVRIQFDEPANKVARAKKVLGVTSYTRVGEEVFDYFYSRECKNDR